jgi:hypothetical protein
VTDTCFAEKLATEVKHLIYRVKVDGKEVVRIAHPFAATQFKVGKGEWRTFD